MTRLIFELSHKGKITRGFSFFLKHPQLNIVLSELYGVCQPI